MNEKMFFKARLYFTGIVTLAIWTLLVWDYYHGGVPSHHILARKDLPSFSNWWGGLLLPLLTWFLTYRIQKRVFSQNNESKLSPDILYGFVGALIFGVLLSVFFTFRYSDLAGFLVLGLIPLALFFPIYRAESLLGFVLGMTFTFGAILPTGIGCIFASIGAVLYLFIRPVILYIVSNLREIVLPNKDKNKS